MSLFCRALCFLVFFGMSSAFCLEGENPYSLWNPRMNNFELSRRPCRERPSPYAVFLFTLPRSGTNFLIGSLSYGLSPNKEWLGKFLADPAFPEEVLEEEKVLELLEYGGVSWCHLYPKQQTVALLEKYNLPITVQIRDPRQATLSFFYHMGWIHGETTDKEIDELLEKVFPKFVRYIEEWYFYVKNHPEKAQILLYEEMIEDPSLHFERILQFHGIPLDAFDRTLSEIQNFWRETRGLHFRKGEKEEWRSFFNAEQIEFMNQRMPDWFSTAFFFST